MDNEKMKNQIQAMNDQEMEQVSGGNMEGGCHANVSLVVVRRDSKGNATHWQKQKIDGDYVGKPFHYVCPRCGRLLHEGTLGRMYCDPCDESWCAFFSLNEHDGIYTGC